MKFHVHKNTPSGQNFENNILSKLFVFPPVCNKTMSYVQEFKLTKCVPPPPPPPSFYEDTQKRSKLKSRPNSKTTPAQPAAATRVINNKRLMCICMNIYNKRKKLVNCLLKNA